MELSIYDRNYSKWEFKSTNDAEPVFAITAYIHPLTSKLFHGDILSTTGSLLHSPYQSKDAIPGVLILDGKTYGRATSTSSSTNNSKLLYKCIPHDPALPCFLIPYEEKVATFNKKKTNKYVTFKIKEWREKHPLGQLTQTIGDVNQPESYYKYQLASKYLQHPISTFTKETIVTLNMKPRENMAEHIAINHQLADRRGEPIFSIDPAGCKDIDDAIGCRQLDKHHYIISIYIANVPLLLDYLNLWHVYSERVSSVYLPTSKLPMLPPILSDDICSLVQGKDRCAFSMDMYIEQKDNATIVNNVAFHPVLIHVQKNYVYEEEALLKNKTYLQLFNLTKALIKQYPYVDQLSDSHELVEFYMIFMNYESSKRLLERKAGIFRSATLGKELDPLPPGLSKDMRAFLKTYQLSQCQYCTHEQVQPHALLGLSSYVHITSPIRRLVDLLNLCELQEDILSRDAKRFKTNWLKRLPYINTTMKAIRKVQNNCNLLATYLKDTTEGRYTGLLFDKTVLADAIYKPEAIYKFSVYIPALKMVSTIKTTQNFDNYRTVVVSAHSFMDEDNVMKKIRVQIA
jgi:exoribonuclease R